eukprot:GHVR01109976.1.p1 GENE.GHVR01109976.1~~GHVR01109976.1.p1  ORF type:complete len:318 (+),score=63.83 GHVR01109976.1:39-992(+)
MEVNEVKEGKVKIKNPLNEVFYNPSQVFNRDLSVLICYTFAKYFYFNKNNIFNQNNKNINKNDNITTPPTISSQENGSKFEILEPLSATGLRSLRYAAELGSVVTQVVANDIDTSATEQMKGNVLLNNLSDKITIHNTDACALMHTQRIQGRRFAVVDIDPYGSAAPFIDAAVQAVTDGGLLCVTSTDMIVLGASQPEVGFYKYGGNPIKAGFVHEMSVRLLLQSVAQSAYRYRRCVDPLLCLSTDFYVRIFVRIIDSPSDCGLAAYNSAHVYQCMVCPSFWVIPSGHVEIKSDKKNNYSQDNKKKKKKNIYKRHRK